MQAYVVDGVVYLHDRKEHGLLGIREGEALSDFDLIGDRSGLER